MTVMGVANYYSNMWERRSHTLAPIDKINSSIVKFKCNKIDHDYSDKIKRVLARDTLLNYPYFNEEFKIHTNARDIQLGAVIIKKGKPIFLYCRKLTDTPNKYTVK